MKLILLLLALALAGCAKAPAAPECDDGGKDVMAYIDPHTGKLDRDDAGDILDPDTGRVAITASEAACRESEDQAVIGAWQGK
jgi:hypothetical protein